MDLYEIIEKWLSSFVTSHGEFIGLRIERSEEIPENGQITNNNNSNVIIIKSNCIEYWQVDTSAYSYEDHTSDLVVTINASDPEFFKDLERLVGVFNDIQD